MYVGKKIAIGLAVAAISVSALAGGTAQRYGNGTYYHSFSTMHSWWTRRLFSPFFQQYLQHLF